MGEKSVQYLTQMAIKQCRQISSTAELDAQILLCWVIKKRVLGFLPILMHG